MGLHFSLKTSIERRTQKWQIYIFQSPWLARRTCTHRSVWWVSPNKRSEQPRTSISLIKQSRLWQMNSAQMNLIPSTTIKSTMGSIQLKMITNSMFKARVLEKKPITGRWLAGDFCRNQKQRAMQIEFVSWSAKSQMQTWAISKWRRIFTISTKWT